VIVILGVTIGVIVGSQYGRLCRIKVTSGNMLFFLRCCLTMSLIRKSFRRLHYPTDVIAQYVRWYLAYSLSLRNLEEMMAECGITVDHSTHHRWVIRLVPCLDKVFRRHKRPVGRRWRMDETYIRVRGQWKYLYRAVDTAGQTIDFLLTARRDAGAALRFFRKAIRHHGKPEMITIDKSGANTGGVSGNRPKFCHVRHLMVGSHGGWGRFGKRTFLYVRSIF